MSCDCVNDNIKWVLDMRRDTANVEAVKVKTLLKYLFHNKDPKSSVTFNDLRSVLVCGVCWLMLVDYLVDPA